MTSEPAVDPTHSDWRQECREKALQGSCNQKILFQSMTRTTKLLMMNKMLEASKSLDILDAAKCFAGIHGDKQVNVMLNELIEKVETLKLQIVKQSTIHMLFKKMQS